MRRRVIYPRFRGLVADRVVRPIFVVASAPILQLFLRVCRRQEPVRGRMPRLIDVEMELKLRYTLYNVIFERGVPDQVSHPSGVF
jgi:hypothetical protein